MQNCSTSDPGPRNSGTDQDTGKALMMYKMEKKAAGRLPLLAFVLALSLPAAAQDLVQETILQRMHQLQATGGLAIGDEGIGAVRLLPEFYERRNYLPAWTNPALVRNLLRRIATAENEGLDPDDYHRRAIEILLAAVERQSVDNDSLRADLDILLTEGLVRLAYHLNFGKVDPGSLDSNWNLSRELRNKDPVEVLQAAVESSSLDPFLDVLTPSNPEYLRLKSELARYRRIEAEGGWPRIAAGPTLRPGITGDRVIALRQRLAATGDLDAAAPDDPRVFDAAVEQAVKRYQSRNRLEADGLAGKRTLAAMNVPVGKRIEQIRVNLERSRWVWRSLESSYLVTNIAGFRVYLVKDGELVWNSRAQVGRLYRATPVFRDSLKYLEFNPTWTLPPTILREDVIPAIQKDRDYLRRNNMSVLDRQGRRLDPETLDWDSFSGRRFPHLLRQEAGPTNPLGRVKFMFPNKHLVYLHDTPSQWLFTQTDRAFSSGCIRVENPMELAELVLADKPGWDRNRIQQVLDSGKTTVVLMEEPLPIYMLYWTVRLDDPNSFGFIADVYDRDDRIARALDGEFKLSLPSGLPEYLLDRP